jgi:PBP1b-binding outer membrane lipoprotein LpoB
MGNLMKKIAYIIVIPLFLFGCSSKEAPKDSKVVLTLPAIPYSD